MDAVLVVGVEGVVGANLAAVCSSSQPVIGCSDLNITTGVCPVETCPQPTVSQARELILRRGVNRVVYCGPTADSCWSPSRLTASDVARVVTWLDAATQTDVAFTLISSDAVFTGPWMFHAENSQSFCSSAQGRWLQEIEQRVLNQRPDALVVRTHAFGWGPQRPDQTQPSWLDRLVGPGGDASFAQLDCMRHASPILASDLAGFVQKAWSAGLVGVYHIAGAERTNPQQFAQRVAHQFGVGFPAIRIVPSLDNAAVGFGLGETSLQTRKVRRALGVGMPLLSEGVQRLFEQSRNGFRSQLQGTSRLARAA